MCFLYRGSLNQFYFYAILNSFRSRRYVYSHITESVYSRLTTELKLLKLYGATFLPLATLFSSSNVVLSIVSSNTFNHVPMAINFLNAFLNSGLNMVQMTGFTKLFMQPSHVVRMNAATPGWHSAPNFVQMASIMLHVKNGTQHTRNTPATTKYMVFIFTITSFIVIINKFSK